MTAQSTSKPDVSLQWVALMASGITDSSLQYHLRNAKNNGVTKEETAAIITHAAMYVGWPKGWSRYRMPITAN